MGLIVAAIILIILGLAIPLFGNRLPVPKLGLTVIRIAALLLGLFFIASTSYVHVGNDEVGHLTKIYGTRSLAPGRIIASDGETGPQAEIIAPGFTFRPLINVLNNFEKHPITEIPDGKYGYLVARDGAELRPDQTFADPIEGAAGLPGDKNKTLSANEMLDARTFLTHGGQKGPQTTVLTPGRYRINQYLWEVRTDDSVTEVPPGTVGVVKANVRSAVFFGNLKTEAPKDCEPTQKQSPDGGELAVPLVPVGCIGIWDRSLLPGKYYINKSAYHVESVDTRVQTLEYKGGYVKRSIDLVISQDGKIEQRPHDERIDRPKTAVDTAVFVKVEGWDVPQELRAVVQVSPTHAPFVVASVGGLAEVEDKIITPDIRSIVRNVMGGVIFAPVICEQEQARDKDGNPVGPAPTCVRGQPVKDGDGRIMMHERPTRVLDLIENRPLIEQSIDRIMKIEGLKAGVDVKEVRLGDPAIPPELLVSRLREQLAQQLSRTYAQEKQAQSDRIATENARATADQQSALVRATIAVQQAEREKQAAQLQGEGERLKLEAIAAGQKAQAGVLGEDRVVELRKYETLLNSVFGFVDKHPEVLTEALKNAHKFVPETVVSGGTDASLLATFGGFLNGSMGGQPRLTGVPAKP